MSTLEQLNKTVFKVVRVLFVSSILLALLTSCSLQKETVEHQVVDAILKTRDKVSSKGADIILCKENSNIEVITIINEFKNGNFDRKNLENRYGIDNPFLNKNVELKQALDVVFKKGQYDFLLKQKSIDSMWDLDFIKSKSSSLNLQSDDECAMYIAKPIVSKNGRFALVYVKFKSHSAVSLLQNKGKKWIIIGSFNNSIY